MEKPTPEQTAAFNAKIDVVDQIIASIDQKSELRTPILSLLLAQNILHNTILALWGTFLANKFEENGRDEGQFNLLFHSFDRESELPEDLQAIIKLMTTGKIDGMIPKNDLMNFFPAGFWKMPEVQRELTTQSMECIASLIEHVCDLHFELPPDWKEKEEKHPEGFYVSPKEQATLLTDSLVELIGEAKIANAEVKAETEESATGETDEKDNEDNGKPLGATASKSDSTNTPKDDSTNPAETTE